MSASHLMLLETLPFALISVDIKNVITYLNPAAEDVLRVTEKSILGKPLTNLFTLSDVAIALVERALTQAETVREYDHSLTVENATKRVTLTASPIFASDEITGALLTIEPQDMLDSLARDAQKREIITVAGGMAAMLAHEVKNPLSGIRGAAQLLRDEVKPESQTLLTLICNEVDRISATLDKIEHFGESPALTRESLNIHEALTYVQKVAMAGFAKRVMFRKDYDPSLPEILCAREPLMHILMNITKNAAEALEKTASPVIRLTTRIERSWKPLFAPQTYKRTPAIAISIADNGPGIAEEIAAHMFEPFTSSKARGRGLGLAIAAKFARDLGGELKLEKTSAAGTTFVLLLPLG